MARAARVTGLNIGTLVDRRRARRGALTEGRAISSPRAVAVPLSRFAAYQSASRYNQRHEHSGRNVTLVAFRDPSVVTMRLHRHGAVLRTRMTSPPRRGLDVQGGLAVAARTRRCSAIPHVRRGVSYCSVKRGAAYHSTEKRLRTLWRLMGEMRYHSFITDRIM